jgi:hypothetical protein
MTVQVRNVVANMTVVDAESLLSPAVLEHIVEAVRQAQDMARADERSRRRDTKVGGCCDECADGEAMS